MDNFQKRAKQVIDVEATTTSVGDFFLTHMPFDNLFVFEKGSTMFESAIDEESLYRELLLDNVEQHKFVMIQGSQGCGKSHLIRWMKERYVQDISPKKEGVLFISRSHNTLQDAIEQILRSNIFSDEIKENELKKIKDANIGLTGEALCRQIVFNFYQAVIEDDGKDCELGQRHRDWLKAFLQDDYIKQKLLLIEKGPIERIRAKLENSGSNVVNQDESPIFDEKSFIIELAEINGRLRSDAARDTVRFAELLNTDALKAEFKEKTANYLNKKVSEVIRRSLTFKTTDFKKLFQSLRKQLKSQGMGLTLFIEDITSFSGLDQTLMEVLITNHQVAENSQYCRIISICGATRKFYEDNVPDNFKERITKNILIKEESVLGKPEKLAQFAARYINAIRVPEADVVKWNAAGANIRNVPIDKKFLSHTWAAVDVNEHKLSIYPFNQAALWNLYQIILLERRTPRMFLKYVILHILEKLEFSGKERFLIEKNFNNGEIRVPAWADVSQEQNNDNYNPDFASQRAIVLRVWGNQTTTKEGDKVGGIERAIFTEFGIPTDIFDGQKSGTGIKPQPKPVSIGEGAVVTPQHQQPQKNEYEELYKELTEWQEHGGILASHIILRNLMLEKIMDALDWEAEGVMPQFVRTYFSSINHLSIEGQKVDIKPDSFVIKRSKEARYALLAVAAFKHKGNNSWDIDDSGDAYINFMTWLESAKAEIIAATKDPKNAGVDVGFLNIASEYACKLLTGQIKPSMSNDDIYSAICEGLRTPLTITGHSDAWRETQSMIAEKGKELHMNNLEFFAKNWGASLKGKAIDKYTYLDVHEIYTQIEKLAKLGFDLTKIQLNSGLPSNTMYGVPTDVIGILVKRFERLVTDERAVVDTNAMFVQITLGNDYSKATAETAINEMNGFLIFLNTELNTPFPVTDYANLTGGKLAADRIVLILDTLKAMKPTLSRQETIAKLTEIDISFLLMCSDIFKKFSRLLNEKQSLVQGGGVGQSATELNNARKRVKDEASEMKLLVGGV